MAKDKELSDNLNVMAGQTMEQARGAMENYLNFFQKSMSASPWAGAELNKSGRLRSAKCRYRFRVCTKANQSKDLKDLVRIQTEFLQTQMKSLTEQAKDLSETATKAATSAMKGISS